MLLRWRWRCVDKARESDRGTSAPGRMGGSGARLPNDLKARALPAARRADTLVPSTSILHASMRSQFITVDPAIHSGTPVFAGTRVPIKALFDHLEAGDAIAVFLDDFPSVSRELAVAVLEEAHVALVRGGRPT